MGVEPELGAELRRCGGGASSCGAAEPVRPRTSLSPPAPPPRAGRARGLASAGERRSPLVRGTVGSAGGVRTQVPAGAELAAVTGPAGPGTGPGLAEGPARPPGPAAGQVGTGRRVCWWGGRGSAGGPRVRGPSLSPERDDQAQTLGLSLPRNQGSQFPSRGRREDPEARHTVGASPSLGFPLCETGSSQHQPNGEFRRWRMRRDPCTQ